jgi:hypothetical protein
MSRPFPGNYRSRKKHSLDGSVPGVEYNRLHGGYNRSPFESQRQAGPASLEVRAEGLMTSPDSLDGLIAAPPAFADPCHEITAAMDAQAQAMAPPPEPEPWEQMFRPFPMPGPWDRWAPGR